MSLESFRAICIRIKNTQGTELLDIYDGNNLDPKYTVQDYLDVWAYCCSHLHGPMLHVKRTSSNKLFTYPDEYDIQNSEVGGEGGWDREKKKNNKPLRNFVSEISEQDIKPVSFLTSNVLIHSWLFQINLDYSWSLDLEL